MIPYKGQIRFANLENRQVLTVNMGGNQNTASIFAVVVVAQKSPILKYRKN